MINLVNSNSTVLAFGSFDPVHEGHIDFLRQAKALGDHLIVVVATNTAIQANKAYTPSSSIEERIDSIKKLGIADTILPGTISSDPYELLSKLVFEIIAVGYDQRPADEIIRTELDKRGKQHVQINRLQPFQPEKYKSSFLRSPKAIR